MIRRMATAQRPAPIETRVIPILREERRIDREIRGPFPPGVGKLDFAQTRQMARDPLPILLDGYARFGPVFSMKIL
jgi:hypothetical protein